jgi:hypothetical protein
MAGAHLHFFHFTTTTTSRSPIAQSHITPLPKATSSFENSLTLSSTTNMSAQPENEQMEGVQDPTTESKGKGKASDDTMEESMDDDSSDESGVEDQVCPLQRTQHPKAQQLT